MTKAQQGSVGQVGMTTSVGHGVQQVVRKGAGAIQQLIGQRYNFIINLGTREFLNKHDYIYILY